MKLKGLKMSKLTTHINYLITLFVFTAFTVMANDQVGDKQIYKIMDKSGLTRTIEGLPVQMYAMAEQMAASTEDQKEYQQFMQILSSSLETDVMLNDIFISMKSNLSMQERVAILHWLDSELAIRAVNAELRSSEPDFEQQLREYLSQINRSPLPSERVAAVKQLVESAKMVEQSSEMVIAMMRSMFKAIKAADPSNEELATQLDTQFEMISMNIAPMMEQEMMQTSLYIYQDLTNEELQQYSAFFQQVTGKKYLSVINGAISSSLNRWGKNLVTQIMKEFAN